MADTAKQLADAEKNHNRLKKLGTTEATKEFGSYPKYIDALKETRLKLNDAKADHEDSLSGETKEPTKEEIQKIREKDIKDIMSTKEKRIKEAEENHEKLKKLGSVEFDTYAEYTKALSNSRLEVNEAKSDHASMAKNVARAERDWKDIPSDWKTEDEDSVPDEAKEPEKKSEPVEEKPTPTPKDKEPWEMRKGERGIPDANLASRGVFKTKKDAEANLAELMGTLNKSPEAKAILDQFGMDSSNTYQVVKSKKHSNRWGIAATHHHEIANAIKSGKSVPAEVLADYPDLVKKPVKEKVEEKPKAKEPWEMTPDTPQSESPVNAPVDALVQYITGDRLNDPAQFRNLYYKLSDPDRVAVAKELNKRGLLHEIDARKKKPMDASTIINSARGQYRNRYYDSKTEYEDFLSGKAKEPEKKPEVEKEKPKAKEPWEISEREYGEQVRQISLTSLRENLRKAKSGEEEPNVFLNGAKSKAALIRTREKDIEDAKYTKPERYSGNHLGFINKAIREGKDVPQANLDRYDIKTEKPAESAKEPEKVAVTPPKEPVAEVKEMKEKPKQQNLDLTDTPKAKEEKPVEAIEIEDAPKGKEKPDTTQEQHDKIESAHKKLDKALKAANRSPQDRGLAKKVFELKEVVNEALDEAGLPRLPESHRNHETGEEIVPRRVWPVKDHTIAGKHSGLRTIGINKKAAAKAAKPPVVPSPKTAATNLKTDGKGTPTTNTVTGKGADLSGDQKAGGGTPVPAPAPEPKKPEPVLTEDLRNAIYAASADLDNSMHVVNNLPKGDPAIRKEYFDRAMNRRHILSKLLEKAGYDHLLQTGKTKNLGQDHGLPEDLLKGAEEFRKVQEEASKAAQPPVAPSPVTPEKDLKAGEATGSEDEKPSATDQKTGDGVPPPKKELNKVQIGQIYKAKEEYDESLKNLRAVKKGDKLERKKQYDTYIGARKNLSNLRVKVGRKALPRTGPINELGEHDGLDEDMIQGVEEHKKAQEEQTASRKPVDQAQVPVALDPVAAEFMKGQESTPGKGPMEAGYKEWEESRPPAPAPVQRIEPTVTPPRIESIVGSTSPLPQTQPAPVAPAGTTPVPAEIAPQFMNATQDSFNAYLAAKAEALKTASAGTVPVPAAPAPQAQVQPAPVPQPQTQAQPAGAAPVAPAPWFPLGPEKGQVTWPPQPTAGVAPAPVAPSGRGSQAASQAAAASGAKPVDQGQFAPSKPQPQQQPEAPAPAPWFPFGQGNGQAPWPPQNDQAIPAPVPQPVPPAPAPAPAPSGDELQKAKQAYSDFVNRSHADNMTKYGGRGTATSQYGDVYEKDKTALQERYKAATLAQGMPWPPNKQPAPAPAPAQPSQQPAPGQPQQKPGTPQPKPPFNPFQRTEPTPAQPKPKPPFNPFQRIEDKVAPRTSRPKQQPETKTQPAPVPVPVPVPQQPMSRLEKVKKALASVGQGIGQAATNASQSVQRVATHGITKAVLAHLGVAALHGINYHKAIKNLGPKQPRKFNPGWHGFTTPVGKPEDEAKAAEQQKAAPEPKEAAEPKTSGKWERRDR